MIATNFVREQLKTICAGGMVLSMDVTVIPNMRHRISLFKFKARTLLV